MKSYYFILDITSGEYITDIKFYSKIGALAYLTKFMQVTKRTIKEFDLISKSEE